MSDQNIVRASELMADRGGDVFSGCSAAPVVCWLQTMDGRSHYVLWCH